VSSVGEALNAVRSRTTRLAQGSVHVLTCAVQRFSVVRAPEAVAGMAYYAFFSLFPLLLFLVSAGGYFLESEQVYAQVLEFVAQAFPISREVIESNLRQVLELRGTIGFLGLLGLMWSASGVFTILARNINLAWPEAEPRSVYQERLMAFAMVGLSTVALVASFMASTLMGIVGRLRIPLSGGGSIYDTPLWTVYTELLPRIVTLLVFTSLYRFVPTAKPRWSAVAVGALAASLAWEGAAAAFAWYLGSGLVALEFAYGSLATVAILMLRVYLGGWIALFGAHLTAAMT
jgi:membrane protein